jgi:hypothetical protein
MKRDGVGWSKNGARMEEGLRKDGRHTVELNMRYRGKIGGKMGEGCKRDGRRMEEGW